MKVKFSFKHSINLFIPVTLTTVNYFQKVPVKLIQLSVMNKF